MKSRSVKQRPNKNGFRFLADLFEIDINKDEFMFTNIKNLEYNFPDYRFMSNGIMLSSSSGFVSMNKEYKDMFLPIEHQEVLISGLLNGRYGIKYFDYTNKTKSIMYYLDKVDIDIVHKKVKKYIDDIFREEMLKTEDFLLVLDPLKYPMHFNISNLDPTCKTDKKRLKISKILFPTSNFYFYDKYIGYLITGNYCVSDYSSDILENHGYMEDEYYE